MNIKFFYKECKIASFANCSNSLFKPSIFINDLTTGISRSFSYKCLSSSRYFRCFSAYSSYTESNKVFCKFLQVITILQLYQVFFHPNLIGVSAQYTNYNKHLREYFISDL